MACVDFDRSIVPDGLRDLTDKIHAMGFKAGIYSSAGRHTCGDFPASLGFETEDATSYAEWGFDVSDPESSNCCY